MDDEGSQPKKRSWWKFGCGGLIALFVVVSASNAIWRATDPEGFAKAQAEREQRERDAEEAQAVVDRAEEEQEAKETTGIPDDAMAVGSVELARAYENNEVAAQASYGDRRLLVTGTVTGISLDLFDSAVVQMEGTNQFLPVQARLTEKDAAAALSKGMSVKVVCERVTEVISAPILSKCRLVD
jgi:hypothetical protein